MHTAEFEPAIPTGERSQTHALDRLAPGTGNVLYKATNLFLPFIIRPLPSLAYLFLSVF